MATVLLMIEGLDFDQNDNDSRGTLAHGNNVAGIAAAKTTIIEEFLVLQRLRC